MESISSVTKVRTSTVPLPSGMMVTFREQNGDDDSIISRQGNALDGSSINKFIAAILKEVESKPVSVNDHSILKWKLRDKYSLLLKSRIFSLGETLLFKYTCPHCNKQGVEPYEENLSNYDWDYSKPFPAKDDPAYSTNLIPPYIKGQEIERELTLSSGHKIKYKYLDGVGEKKLLAVDRKDLNKNHELLVRSIQWQDETGKYITLENFKHFSARDMAEIRKDILEMDEQWEGLTTITCQNPECRQSVQVPLISQPDFFYPVQI